MLKKNSKKQSLIKSSHTAEPFGRDLTAVEKKLFVKGQEVNTIDHDDRTPIVEIIDLHLGFVSRISKKYKEVIRGVSLKIFPNEVLGVIGESGSGKSVLTSAIMGLLHDDAVIKSGKIKIHGIDVSAWSPKDWDKSGFRGPVISSVFQNPTKTLNPTMRIDEQLMETLLHNHRVDNWDDAKKMAIEYLQLTQIPNPEQVMKMYPHQLSGGMIQRIVIASAIATEAQLIIFDEPTTALDPVVQAEIISLLKILRKKVSSSFIFISHDIGVVSSIAEKIMIMYAGQILEYGYTKEILWYPQHPYTWFLLLAMPDLNYGKELFSIPGSVPPDATDIKHDVFAHRNSYALAIDFVSAPGLYKLPNHHYVSSRLVSEEAPDYCPPELIFERWKKYKSLED